MRVSDGQYTIVLPEQCEPHTLNIMAFSGGIQEYAHEGYWIAMIRIEWQEMMTMSTDRRALRGIPTMYAIAPGNTEIVYHPTSDKEHDMSIQYCPALKVI